jgi:hypothetical protein
MRPYPILSPGAVRWQGCSCRGLHIPLAAGFPVGLSKTLDLYKRGSLRPFGPLFKLESLVERLTHDDLHASTV